MASSVIADGQAKTGLTLDTLVAVQKGTNVTVTTPEKTADPTVAFSEMGKATLKSIMYSSEQPDIGVTGNVMVFGSDGKLKDSTMNLYNLPLATPTSQGTMKVGDSLGINNGILNVEDDRHNHVISNVDGLQDALNSKLGSGANAVSATKLASARTITLAGDVTGSTSFDGSANVSINATVADDSHNHVIDNVDGLQSALNSKLGTSDNAVSSSKIDIPDVRSDNQAPSWYMSNYGHSMVSEFKYISAIGASSILSGNYCGLTTIVPWGDPSGGYPVQVATAGNGIGGMAFRTASSTSGWGTWKAILTTPNWAGVTTHSNNNTWVSMSSLGRGWVFISGYWSSSGECYLYVRRGSGTSYKIYCMGVNWSNYDRASTALIPVSADDQIYSVPPNRNAYWYHVPCL